MRPSISYSGGLKPATKVWAGTIAGAALASGLVSPLVLAPGCGPVCGLAAPMSIGISGTLRAGLCRRERGPRRDAGDLIRGEGSPRAGQPRFSIAAFSSTVTCP